MYHTASDCFRAPNAPRLLSMNILLHICCGPCAIYPVEALRQAHYSVEGFFYNPNIYPYSEYLKRKEAAEVVARYLSLPFICHYYDDKVFLKALLAFEERLDSHRWCWYSRLKETAKFAKERQIKYYTTTLLVSPYQDIGIIVELGRQAGAEEGVDFLEMDFRQGFAHSHQISRQLGVYHQNYCGCFMSEKEAIEHRMLKKKSLKRVSDDGC